MLMFSFVCFHFDSLSLSRFLLFFVLIFFLFLKTFHSSFNTFSVSVGCAFVNFLIWSTFVLCDSFTVKLRIHSPLLHSSPSWVLLDWPFLGSALLLRCLALIVVFHRWSVPQMSRLVIDSWAWQLRRRASCRVIDFVDVLLRQVLKHMCVEQILKLMTVQSVHKQ